MYLEKKKTFLTPTLLEFGLLNHATSIIQNLYLGTEPKFIGQISNQGKRPANYVSICKKYGPEVRLNSFLDFLLKR